MNRQAATLVRKLKLQKHPEGGYFRQTYRSGTKVNVKGYGGPRDISTAIYYLLVSGEFSAFHRIRSDEIWHHYSGGAVTLYAISDDGKLYKIKISREMPQTLIKAGTWFAASPGKSQYCLLGCTVSPGFDYRDWELGNRSDLAKMYPQHERLIERYTK